jgi:hypothetical protein
MDDPIPETKRPLKELFKHSSSQAQPTMHLICSNQILCQSAHVTYCTEMWCEEPGSPGSMDPAAAVNHQAESWCCHKNPPWYPPCHNFWATTHK